MLEALRHDMAQLARAEADAHAEVVSQALEVVARELPPPPPLPPPQPPQEPAAYSASQRGAEESTSHAQAQARPEPENEVHAAVYRHAAAVVQLFARDDDAETPSLAPSEQDSSPARHPPPFTTLGLPASSVRAAAMRDEQEHLRSLERPFNPRINPQGAEAARPEMPVEEILLGKGKGAALKREYHALVHERMQLKAKERAVPMPRGTNELAQRHAERTGQTAAERLMAPRRPSREKALLEQLEREKAALLSAIDYPYAPNVSGSARGGEAARRAISRSAQPAYTTISAASPPRYEDDEDEDWHRPTSVAERSATWAQLKEHRRLQLVNRQRQIEDAQCTFRPASARRAADRGRAAVGRHGSSSVATERRGSVADVQARTVAWKAEREVRLEAAREEQFRRLSMPLSARRASQPPPPQSRAHAEYAWAAPGFVRSGDQWVSEENREPTSAAPMVDVSDPSHLLGGEPRFMAPTANARERLSCACADVSSAWTSALSVAPDSGSPFDCAAVWWGAPREEGRHQGLPYHHVSSMGTSMAGGAGGGPSAAMVPPPPPEWAAPSMNR